MSRYNFFKSFLSAHNTEEVPTTSASARSSSSYGAPEELLTSIVGSWGRWRLLVSFVFCMVMVLHGLNLFAAELLAPENLSFNCTETKQNSCYTSNGSMCHNFVYSQRYGYTLTEKWNLVCDKRHRALIMNILFRSGLVLGFIVCGHFADSWGRRKVLFVSLVLQSGIGLLLSTSLKFWIFAAVRLVYGFCLSGAILTVIVFMCEISSNNWRTFQLSVLCLVFAVGHTLLPYVWMIFANYMTTILLISVPQIILFIFVGVVRESANWLLCNNQTTSAESVLLAVANFNGNKMPSTFRIRPIDILNTGNRRNRGFLDILKLPTTRWTILPLYLVWLLASFTNQLVLTHILMRNEDHLFVITLSGAINAFSAILSMLLCNTMHHKITISIGSILACCSTIAAYVINRQYKEYKYMVFDLQLAGYSMYSVTIFTLWNITPRLFATEMRGQCTGVAFAIGEISFIVARLLFRNIYADFTIFVTTFSICTFIIVLCCISFVSVHKRELPDFMDDCVNFKTSYKPTRWSTIRAASPTIDETEIKIVDFERGTSLTVQQNSPFYFYGFRRKTSDSQSS